jgi:hypothetical protein
LYADEDVDGAADDGNMFQTSKAGSNQKGLSVENNVLKMLGTISLVGASSVSASERLLSILENDQKPTSQESLFDEIAKTTKIKDEYCAKVDSLWSMKRNILHQEPTCDKAKKLKMPSLVQSVVEHKKMINTLDQTFKSQRKRLEEMTKGNGGEVLTSAVRVETVHSTRMLGTRRLLLSLC